MLDDSPRPSTARELRQSIRPPTFFLGIGFQRCGTSWLHHQFTHHPMIWVPPVKELHYWNSQRDWGIFQKYYLIHIRQMRSMSRFDIRSSAKGRKRFDEYVQAHGRWALRYFFGSRSLSWYRDLFPGSGFVACGEITPDYVSMHESRITQVLRFEPTAKIIVLLRNPIEQAWSMAAKPFSYNPGRRLAGVSDEVLHQRCLEHARHLQYHPPVARWQQLFGRSQVHIGWHDHIVANKAGFLTAMAHYLGVDPAPFLGNRRAGEKRQNVIDYGDRLMPPTLRRQLSELLLPMTEELAHAAGGCAVDWAGEMRATAAGRRPLRVSTPGAALAPGGAGPGC